MLGICFPLLILAQNFTSYWLLGAAGDIGSLALIQSFQAFHHTLGAGFLRVAEAAIATQVALIVAFALAALLTLVIIISFATVSDS